MREFATAVKALAADETLTREALCQQLSALADAALNRRAPSRAGLIRAQLLSRHRQARALLGRLVLLPFAALSAHPVIEALAQCSRNSTRGSPIIFPTQSRFDLVALGNP